MMLLIQVNVFSIKLCLFNKSKTNNQAIFRYDNCVGSVYIHRQEKSDITISSDRSYLQPLQNNCQSAHLYSLLLLFTKSHFNEYQINFYRFTHRFNGFYFM